MYKLSLKLENRLQNNLPVNWLAKLVVTNNNKITIYNKIKMKQYKINKVFNVIKIVPCQANRLLRVHRNYYQQLKIILKTKIRIKLNNMNVKVLKTNRIKKKSNYNKLNNKKWKGCFLKFITVYNNMHQNLINMFNKYISMFLKI